MHKKIAMVLAFAFLIGCSSGYKLMYKGEPGDVNQFKIDTDMEMSMQMMGREMNFTTEVINLISQKINTVDKEGSLNVSFIYDSLSFSSTNPQMAQAKEKVDEVFEQIKGMEIKCTISRYGELLDVSNVDSLIPGQFKQMVNPRQTFDSFSPELPQKKVEIGDTWTSEKTMPVESSGMKMQINSKGNYVLAGKEKIGDKELLKITYTSEMLIDGQGEQMGMKMAIEGDGEAKGHYLFDEKAGVIQDGESETQMDLTIAITGTQNMTMPMTQFIKAKVSRIK